MLAVGIDIGTSYSSISIVDEDGNVQPIRVANGVSAFGDSFSIPSSIFVDDNGETVIGQVAMNMSMKDPSRFKSEFKRDIGNRVPYVLGKSQLLPEDCYKEMLIHLITCAEKATGKKIDKAYITYPAHYCQDKINLILLAAKRIGLMNVEAIDEPTAAAYFYYSKGNVNVRDKLLVYDFGGGTFNVSLMQYATNGFSPLTFALSIEHCGGLDIDRIIFNDIYQYIPNEIIDSYREIPLNLNRLHLRIMEMSVKAKHQLSTTENYEDIIDAGFGFIPYTLSRGKLNQMISPLIEETLDRVSTIIKNAGLKISDIDKILAVGGSSRIPFVQEKIKQLTGKLPLENADHELAACMGAALFGIKTEDTHSKNARNFILNTISYGGAHIVGVTNGGQVIANGTNDCGQCNVDSWYGIVSVAAGGNYTIGLKNDGSVVAVGSNKYGECNISSWLDIKAVAAGWNYTIGLKQDGTLVATGDNRSGECNINSWHDITAIALGSSHTIGLKSDGTVIAVGENKNGQCDVGKWYDIVAIAAGNSFTLGLRKDGFVVATGSDENGACNVGSWHDIKAIAAGSFHSIGLKEDGTVVTVGDDLFGETDLDHWQDIVAIAAGMQLTVGIKRDGTIVLAGLHENVHWENIAIPLNIK